MEAMLTVPVAKGADAGNVEQVLRPGYLLHERVLRAAQVGVGEQQIIKTYGHVSPDWRWQHNR